MITSLFLSVIIRKQINGGERRFVFKRLVGFACEKRQVYDILRVAPISNKEDRKDKRGGEHGEHF